MTIIRGRFIVWRENFAAYGSGGYKIDFERKHENPLRQLVESQLLKF